MATAGKILMFPVGNWTSGNNYGFLDIVYYGGSSYVAKTDITNSTTNPATDTTNWQILAHGYIADTLSGIDGIDTSGLIGTAGAIVSSQALMDKIADMVATKLVLKTAISNQQINDTTKVTGSALSYSMNQTITGLGTTLDVTNASLAELSTFSSASATLNSLVKTTDHNYIQKIGKTCAFSFIVDFNEASTFTLYVENVIGTLPVGYRPSAITRTAVTLRNGVFVRIGLLPNGNITITPYGTMTGGTNLGAGVSITYITA